MSKSTKHILYITVLLLAVNFIGHKIHYRWDMTKDKRYSISKPTVNLLKTLNKDVHISVYLSGNLPFDFEKLSKETSYFLEELATKNNRISFTMVNPKGKEETLAQQGLNPSRLTIQEDGKISESSIFPYAIVRSGKKRTLINLLKSSYFENQESQIENAIQNLEFAFADGIQSVTANKKQKIAILKGNGELQDIYQYDWLRTLGKNYHLAPFTLDSISDHPQTTLQKLKEYDLIIISKPTEAFTEKEKFTLDQYTMSGGKSIWLLDMVHTPKDSLMQNGKLLAYQRDLNLTDYLFNYGIRIQKHLVRDLYATNITLATGKVGNNTQFDQFLWDYYPLIKSNNKHVISKNIGEIKLEFVSSIDTLNSALKKTPLLETSNLTKILKVPNFVDLASIGETKDMETYSEGSKILGVLIEGNFDSAYKNRIKPYKTKFTPSVKNNKMIVIADGDISSNDIAKGQPLALGLDKWNQQFYNNKQFLMNAVNYLLNDNGLIQLRTKKVIIDKINKPKAFEEKLKWQWINLLLPTAILGVFGLINFYVRKRKYL
ncbi:MAG: gliding motility-associated ABC transporter substrate-binding protein GldG [Wenyingzhuangia sp.]|uniref:gliding motility-associated ABC transporter substrate-binding protein GldG n=1 Tax=Wenyingzhuangia sp. TaxID=1964193 RepID=UPI003219C0E1